MSFVIVPGCFFALCFQSTVPVLSFKSSIWFSQMNNKLTYLISSYFKVIVLLVGTNNHGDTAEEIADGIRAIITLIRDKQPQAYLVNLKITLLM